MKVSPSDGVNLLILELFACARYIKTWESIALASDKLHQFPEYNNFFGHLQQDFMYKLIAISLHKIVDDTKEYLKACLKEIFTESQRVHLLEKSKIDSALKKLKKEYEKTYIKPFRNKRIAHIEYTDTLKLSVGKASADLLEFYKLIAQVEHSLAYISHFVRNPDAADGSFLLQENSTAGLDAYFERGDTFIKDLNKLLAHLSAEKGGQLSK